VPLHVDGTQAVGKIGVQPADVHVGCHELSSPQISRPRAFAALFARRRIRIRPLLIGGRRSAADAGDRKCPGIVAMGKAAELAKANLPEMARVGILRDRLEAGISENID